MLSSSPMSRKACIWGMRFVDGKRAVEATNDIRSYRPEMLTSCLINMRRQGVRRRMKKKRRDEGTWQLSATSEPYRRNYINIRDRSPL